MMLYILTCLCLFIVGVYLLMRCINEESNLLASIMVSTGIAAIVFSILMVVLGIMNAVKPEPITCGEGYVAVKDIQNRDVCVKGFIPLGR